MVFGKNVFICSNRFSMLNHTKWWNHTRWPIQNNAVCFRLCLQVFYCTVCAHCCTPLEFAFVNWMCCWFWLKISFQRISADRRTYHMDITRSVSWRVRISDFCLWVWQTSFFPIVRSILIKLTTTTTTIYNGYTLSLSATIVSIAFDSLNAYKRKIALNRSSN